MSLRLQIFIKVLLYSVIIMAVRGVISKIQKPSKELTSTELGERFIDRKIFSIIYLVVAIGFEVVLVFTASLPSNIEGTIKGIVIGGFVLLILFFLLMSFLYGRFYVKIGKEEIYWRKMCGKEEKARYEDITSFSMNGSGNLKLYQGDKCILNFATAEHRIFIMEVLKRHRVDFKTSTNIATVTMKMGKGYVISNTGTSIKIPKFYQNVEMFESIISKHHWSWK